MTKTQLDQVRAALKVVDYRYFGHYEFSDAQWEAFGILETFAKERLAALDAANAGDELRPSRERVLRDALERSLGCINGLLKRTPVRDVSETLAEIEHALAATQLPVAALDAEKGAAVAWEIRVDGKWKGCLRHKGLVDQITKGRDVEITPLYTSPPQAAPSESDHGGYTIYHCTAQLPELARSPEFSVGRY